MADFNLYINQLLKHEKGYVDNKKDPGGATNLGITLNTWRRSGYDIDKDGDIDKEDIKRLTKPMVLPLYKKEYWDVHHLDKMKNQSIANLIFDHSVNASPFRAARMAQEVLKNKFKVNLNADGIIGPKTLAIINSVNQEVFFKSYFDLRKLYYLYRANKLPANNPFIPFFLSIKLKPSNDAREFINGWLNRLSTFTYSQITRSSSYVKENTKSVLNIMLLCLVALCAILMFVYLTRKLDFPH